MTTEIEVFDVDGIEDLSNVDEAYKFRVDDDVFTCVTEIPLFLALEMQGHHDAFKSGTPEQRIAALRQLFEIVLIPSSAERMVERLSSTANPIGVRHIRRIIPKIMGRFSERPTQSPSDSSDGRDDPATGTTSTDDSSAEE